MEFQAACLLCQADSAVQLFEKYDKFGLSPDPFGVVECPSCGLGYVNPRPDESEIGHFYPETYSWKEASDEEGEGVPILNRLEKFYRFHLLRYEVKKAVARLRRWKGRVLDIGCGTGDRLRVFREKGFEVEGVEPSLNALYARKKLGLNVFEGNLSQSRFPNDSFDLVTLYNVLEHLHDPGEVLSEIRRILKKDGLLVVEVPNKDCLQYRFFKERWSAFDVPRDLYYFNPKTLSKLLETAGFGVTTLDFLNNWWHPPTLVTTLFPSLDPQLSWTFEKEGRHSAHLKLVWVLATFFAAPFAYLESLLGRGALMTAYAQKR